MANLFFLSLLLFQYFLASSLSQSLVPAIYIFGSTGRFTNGATIADLIAEKLGLQVSIHYSPTKSSSNQYLTGYNYASGPAGILPETGTAYLSCCISENRL
ncbi:SGNH hydrolase-type esterase domain containing protein [Parasponia andersonii]|uniref:SGNH hydrolase-type esterase domain containing protein n=1 Tax=Parasponia andersonii TaxID=3476 RepID=A0A2P5E5L5_PARAD|nr:SGNH hydrolase-type esterase domain containing protein [Parasponia andersonii]